MKNLLILIIGLTAGTLTQAQKIKGSIQQGSSANVANIVYLPDHNSVEGEYANYLSVSIAIPTAEAPRTAPTIASAGIFASTISFTPAVPFSYTSGAETIYSWICPNNTSFSMAWRSGVSFVGAIVTFPQNEAIPSKVRLIDFTKNGPGGGKNFNTNFGVGVNVPPFDLTDYNDFFFTIVGDNGSAKGIYSNGDRYVETSLLKKPVGISNLTSFSIGAIYPNPASSKLNVIIESPQQDDVTLVVTDVAGRTVKQQIANVQTGSNIIPVDVAKLSQGSYVVKVLCKSSDCVTPTAKFNKQ